MTTKTSTKPRMKKEKAKPIEAWISAEVTATTLGSGYEARRPFVNTPLKITIPTGITEVILEIEQDDGDNGDD